MVAIANFVQVNVSVSASQSPQVEAFGVPLVASYFPSFPTGNSGDRVRFYTSITGLVADGFTAASPTYKAMATLFEQDPAPAVVALGRRALPYSQVLSLTLADTVVGSTYSVTVVGSDNKSHTVKFVSTGVPATDATTFKNLLNGGVVATGTSPPAVTVTGTPSPANSPLIEIDITTPGARGTALFTWKLNGQVQQTGQTTAATFTLGSTGLTANFATGSNYSADNVYVAQYLNNIGTVGGTSATVTLSQSVGLLTDLLNWTPNFVLLDQTADPGIATDLDTIRAANNVGWYGLVLDSNSSAEIQAAAAWTEATGVGGKFAFFNNSDAVNVTATSVPTDVFSALQGRAYGKCYCQYSGKQLLSYGGASAAGYALAHNPGSYALSYKTEPGVLVDDDQSLTQTQAQVLNTASVASPGTGGRNGNYYATVAGLPTTWPGVSPSGEWVDVTIFVDWVQATMQADVFAYLKSKPKVPLTDSGILGIANVIETRLRIGASTQYGGIDPDGEIPITVTVPRAAAIPPTDRQARNVPGVSWQATLSGAVNTVGIQGTLTP